MTAELIFVETYECPRCQAELETPPGCGAMWLVCPRCGRTALPPESNARVPRTRPVVEPDVLFIGTEDDGAFAPLAPIRPARRPISVLRIILLLGLVFCIFGVADAFLEQNTMRAAGFGMALLVFVGVMTYPTRRGPQ